MNLIIDIGNTLQKIAIFNNDEIAYCQSFSNITENILTNIFKQFPIKYSIISSVTNKNVKMEEFLKTNTQIIQYSHETKFPMKVLYKSKKTLGVDRIANAVGAKTLFPNKNVLSIQAGTCLVFDFVNEKGEYLGGSISPGLKARFELLHKKTKKLPLLSASDNSPDFIGNDTDTSIYCGVINGAKYEIDGFIEDYKAKYEKLIVILTGGDSVYLKKLIKNTIFAAPNVVMLGLNEIIKYNV